MIPKTQIIVMIIPEIIAITPLVRSPISLIVSPARANNPTIISFQIRAMINPNAAAIAVAIFIFTSASLTTLFFTSIKLPFDNLSLFKYLYPYYTSNFIVIKKRNKKRRVSFIL